MCLVAALVHALLFAIAYPPLDVWPAAFVSLAPLVWLALRVDRSARAAGCVWLVSTAMWLVLERWLIGVSAVGWPLLAGYLALYPAAFVWIGGRIARRWPESQGRIAGALATLWVALEFLRGVVVLTGYPWFLLAHPLIGTPIAQLAEWVGVYGVSLIIALPQALGVTGLVRCRSGGARAVSVAGAGAILTLALTSGAVLEARARIADAWSDQPGDAGPTASLAVVQTNVPQSNKVAWSVEDRVRDFASMRDMTLDAATPGAPDLIVWPETMFPGETLSPDAVTEIKRAGLVYEDGTPAWVFNEALLDLQRTAGAPMLVGSLGYDGLHIEATPDGVEIEQEGKFNSAFLIEGGAVQPERYDKMHLTPFGEVMPGISWNDRLEGWLLSLGASGMAFDLDAGRSVTVFAVPLRGAEPGQPRALRVVTPICFETATPGVCRRLVFSGGVRRADVLVNVTNDGWFGSAPGKRAQALQVARWRCIELRTPMVRAANTGISASIDSAGGVQAAGPENRSGRERVAGVMRATVSLPRRGLTVYARIGDAAGWLSLLVAGLAAAVTLRRAVGGAGGVVNEGMGR